MSKFQPNASQPFRPKRTGPWPWIGSAAAAVLVALLLWFTLRADVPKPDGSPVAVAKYVGSPAFEKLPPEKQKPYRDAMMATFQNGGDALSGLSEADRRSAMRNLWHARGREQMDEFFSLTTGAERNAYFAEQDQERAQRATSRPARGQGGGGGNADRPRRNVFERPDPVNMAEHAEMIAARRRYQESTGQPSRGGR